MERKEPGAEAGMIGNASSKEPAGCGGYLENQRAPRLCSCLDLCPPGPTSCSVEKKKTGNSHGSTRKGGRPPLIELLEAVLVPALLTWTAGFVNGICSVCKERAARPRLGDKSSFSSLSLNSQEQATSASVHPSKNNWLNSI